MTETADTAARAPPSRAVVQALTALGGATAASVLLWAQAGPAITPVVAAACFWAMWKAPLRASAGILILVLLGVDDSQYWVLTAIALVTGGKLVTAVGAWEGSWCRSPASSAT